MRQNARPGLTSRLSSRSPVVKYDDPRTFPATTVLLPAKLHSDSCSSLFSSWDIESEEERQEGGGRRRAPLASFRRSYVLSDRRGSTPPPVTLSLRQSQIYLQTLEIEITSIMLRYI